MRLGLKVLHAKLLRAPPIEGGAPLSKVAKSRFCVQNFERVDRVVQWKIGKQRRL